MPDAPAIRLNLPVDSSSYYCSLRSVAMHTITESRPTLNHWPQRVNSCGHATQIWNMELYIYGSMSIAQRVSRIYGGIMPSVPRSNYIKCSCQYVCTYQILPYMHENMKSLHIRNRRGKVLRFWKPMLHTLANE